MLNIRIICIGKLKESYWREAVGEYEKRLSSYCKLEIAELREARLPANASPADEEIVREAEEAALLQEARPVDSGRDYIIALDPSGKKYSSPGFAEHLGRLALDGRSRITFLIGGSLGFSDSVRRETDELMSFSDLTFTHQMMRPILLEQIYRAFKINNNEKYHK